MSLWFSSTSFSLSPRSCCRSVRGEVNSSWALHSNLDWNGFRYAMVCQKIAKQQVWWMRTREFHKPCKLADCSAWLLLLRQLCPVPNQRMTLLHLTSLPGTCESFTDLSRMQLLPKTNQQIDFNHLQSTPAKMFCFWFVPYYRVAGPNVNYHKRIYGNFLLNCFWAWKPQQPIPPRSAFEHRNEKPGQIQTVLH